MMAYQGNKVITLLDRLAIAVTGQMAKIGLNPRLSIFANLVFMAIGIAGLVLCAQGQFGPWLVFAAMFASAGHTVIVEQGKRGNARLDERERAIFWKATAIGGSVTCVLAANWVMFLGSFADQGMWHPDRPDEWQAAGLFLLGLMAQLTNIASAWMTPAYAAELDGDA